MRFAFHCSKRVTQMTNELRATCSYTQGRVRALHILRDPSRSMSSLEPPTAPTPPIGGKVWGRAIGMHLDNPQLYGTADVDLFETRPRPDQKFLITTVQVSAMPFERREWAHKSHGYRPETATMTAPFNKSGRGLSAADETIASAVWWAHGRSWGSNHCRPHPHASTFTPSLSRRSSRFF